MRILPNPAKEALNQRRHRLDFSRVGELLQGAPTIDYWDDRPLGYQHEARVRVLGRLGAKVLVLVFEPVEIEGGVLAAKPISLRYAGRAEELIYWSRIR